VVLQKVIYSLGIVTTSNKQIFFTFSEKQTLIRIRIRSVFIELLDSDLDLVTLEMLDRDPDQQKRQQIRRPGYNFKKT